MKARYQAVLDEIARNCDLVGRDPASVTLIAASKTQPADIVRKLYDLGHLHFGESRLQELIPKAETLPPDIVWHFIGKLQSNKLRRAAEICDVIHTIETESQVKEISKLSKPIQVLIEVNTANEPQKSGILEKSLDEFHNCVIQSDLAIFRGLMTIGPIVREAEDSRPYFEKLRRLNEKVGGDWLSMGMSKDFGVAIQEGATHVRVGTSLFGER
ncbi:MAG: YggS family pyridoxal phosphate-dependent enzyme [Armatimonadetes bacterium]|nr:YggS family pyridoxal phosphate-dependent enzyme [Armatimonadota bacterium]MBS1728254.1 YggS family pyridoxal phosphate-dependent enzyme [Armatimonadota bacterium]